MGRKKSVVLMVLLTIVIVALCALTVFPAFTFPWDPIKGWQPAVNSLDAGSELRGGYYTYYYPEGVISASEYKDNYENFAEQSDKDDYAAKYVAHKGLYLEKDEDLGIFDDEMTATSVNGIANVSDTFKTEFDAVVEEVSLRYQQKGFSQHRIAVIDDYAIRVEVPAAAKHTDTTDQNALSALALFSRLGEITIKNGSADISEIVDAESVAPFIQYFSVEVEYGYAYIVVTLTNEGKSVFGGIKDSLSAFGTEGGTFLNFYVTDTSSALLAIGSDNFTADMRIKVPVAMDYDRDQADSYAITLNSALRTGGFDFEFDEAQMLVKEIKDDGVMLYVYIALGVAILLCLVLPIVFFGRYGVMSGYTTLSYLIVVGLCFALITKGVFEITLGSLLVFLFGLLMVNAGNAYVYSAIKKEVASGKTVTSATKKGYNKTVWHLVDTYAVLLIGALTAFIGFGGLTTLASQAIICVITAAFCNLLWGRGINHVFLSASKDKYKYFRFVREEDEDDED